MGQKGDIESRIQSRATAAVLRARLLLMLGRHFDAAVELRPGNAVARAPPTLLSEIRTVRLASDAADMARNRHRYGEATHHGQAVLKYATLCVRCLIQHAVDALSARQYGVASQSAALAATLSPFHASAMRILSQVSPDSVAVPEPESSCRPFSSPPRTEDLP